MKQTGWNRRDFLKAGAHVAGVAGVTGVGANATLLAAAEISPTASAEKPATTRTVSSRGSTKFADETLSRVAYPLGGIGAGMICLEGTGALSNVSIRNRPDLFHEPCVFAALAIRGSRGDAATARVLEGPVPGWKIFGMPNSGLGEGDHTYGFPRFRNASFAAHFPFGTVSLSDPDMPVTVATHGLEPLHAGRCRQLQSADDCPGV